jgi:hypothetical protein
VFVSLLLLISSHLIKVVRSLSFEVKDPQGVLLFLNPKTDFFSRKEGKPGQKRRKKDVGN